MQAVALTLAEANAFVAELHRHHAPVHRDKFRCGVADGEGRLRGIVQVGRPVSRILDDGKTVEVVRLCTDGYKNACSFLYARAAKASEALGYEKIITYILESEDGTSLRAAGWHKEADTSGGQWDCPSRPRATTAPSCRKQRWAKLLRENII